MSEILSIVLVIFILLAFYSFGFLTGFKTRRLAIKLQGDTFRTNTKASRASDYFLTDEGETEDNLAEDKLDRRKKEEEAGFFS